MTLHDKVAGTIYEIQVQGELDQSWKSYFNGLAITSTYTAESPTTTLIAPVVDQPALRGLLCKLWDLNLSLISVRRLEMYREKMTGKDSNGIIHLADANNRDQDIEEAKDGSNIAR